MNFRKRTPSAEPEINLIPFIDVLLVVLIFLMLTTAWSLLIEINMTLSLADTQKQKDRPQQIVLSVKAQGQYAVNQTRIEGSSVAALAAALDPLAYKEVTWVISADAQATHKYVVSAMEAARRTGLSQITLATQSPEPSGS